MKRDALVADIMTTQLIKVSPDDTLKIVQEIFSKHRIHHIPVVHDNGTLLGMISKTDFAKIQYGFSLVKNEAKKIQQEKLYESLLVEEVMTSKIYFLNVNDEVSEAAKIFAKNHFHALPVLDGGVLVGLLTTYDLLHYAYLKPEKKKKFG